MQYTMQMTLLVVVLPGGFPLSSLTVLLVRLWLLRVEATPYSLQVWFTPFP